MVSSISGPIRPGRDTNAHGRPRSGRARDGQAPADLGRTASHRLQAEVTRVSAGGVEAVPVVTDLDENLSVLSLDPNVRRGRPGVPQHIRERLAPDREQ